MIIIFFFLILILISYIYQHIMYAKKTIAISSEVSIDIYDDGALRMVVGRILQLG